MSRTPLVLAGLAIAIAGVLLVTGGDDAPKDATSAVERTREAGQPARPEIKGPVALHPDDAPDTPEGPQTLQGLPEGDGFVQAVEAPDTRRLEGWVTDSNGEPVVDALVTVRGETAAASMLSDEDGRFVFAGVTRDAVRISADGADLGYAFVRIPGGGAIDSIQLTLEAVGWITVQASAPETLGATPSAFRAAIRSDATELVEARNFGSDSDESGYDFEGGFVVYANLGERVPVKAGLTYRISVGPEDAIDGRTFELDEATKGCGSLRVRPGDDAIVDCTPAERVASVAGRVIDTQGKGLPHIRVRITDYHSDADGLGDLEEPHEPTTHESRTNGDGYFRVDVPRRRPTLVTLSTAAPVGYAIAERRQVNLRPGTTTEIGDVLMMAEAEVPVGWLDEDFGGIGGLVSLDERGVFLIDVESDCPLRMAGVEPGDVITRIDGMDAAEMTMSEILKRLRGEVGTAVSIAVRNPMGETWDLDITRGVIRAASKNWPSGGHPAPPDVIDFEALEIDGEIEMPIPD